MQMAGCCAGIRNTLSAGGDSDGADKQPLGLHVPGAPAPPPAIGEAERQDDDAGTKEGSNPFVAAAPAPAGLRPTASEFQRRQGEAGSLAGPESDHAGFSGRDAGLHRDNSASGMLADSAAGSSAEWAGAKTYTGFDAACWLSILQLCLGCCLAQPHCKTTRKRARKAFCRLLGPVHASMPWRGQALLITCINVSGTLALSGLTGRA